MEKLENILYEETQYLGSSNEFGFVDAVERIVETSATGELIDIFDRPGMRAYSPIRLHSFED